MKSYIIDAGVLALHFIDDPRIKPFINELTQKKAQFFICDVNLSEYYYKVCEKLGKETADVRYHQVRGSDIISVSTDEELTKMAGEKKYKHRGKLSLADCFALALSQIKKATILTTDSELAKVKEVESRHFPV
jgi:predicted nucleic acid-binding protein